MHLEELNVGELPSAAHARENKDGCAGLLCAQLFDVEADIGGEAIGVEHLRAQHTRLPDFRLAADNAFGEGRQFALYDERVNLRFSAALDCLIELGDEFLC